MPSFIISIVNISDKAVRTTPPIITLYSVVLARYFIRSSAEYEVACDWGVFGLGILVGRFEDSTAASVKPEIMPIIPTTHRNRRWM
jgi:hypothetical protein